MIVERMRFRSALPEWEWMSHWWAPRISNPLYLINTNDLASNSLRRFTENLVFADKLQKNLIVTIRYLLTVTIAQKGDILEKEKCKHHPTRKRCKQRNHLSVILKN